MTGKFLQMVSARVFTEIGKNINQDKVLSLKRYVEDYHKYVASLNPPPVKPKNGKKKSKRVKKRKGKILYFRIVEIFLQSSGPHGPRLDRSPSPSASAHVVDNLFIKFVFPPRAKDKIID